MKRSLVGMTLFVLVSAAMGLVSYGKVFTETYGPSKDSPLSKAKCAACHVGTTKRLNPYGTDLAKALSGSKKLTAEVLAKIENLDSDKDGVSNIAEIKSGTLPGAK